MVEEVDEIACAAYVSAERANVAVHGKHAIRDKQFVAGLIFYARELLFRVGNVFVIENENFGSRKARAIDDRSMVELVGNDKIVFAEKSRNRARVSGESGLKDDAGFDVLEARNLFFEVHVNAHCSGDRADSAGTDSELTCSFERGLAQLGMSG